MKLGIRGHDFETRPLHELAQVLKNNGLSSVQFVLKRSLPEVNTDLGSLSHGFANHVRKTFAKHDLHISVLGCYFNIIHPDPAERRYGIERFKEHIRYVKDFGCSLVATETGNVNADTIYTEENFKEEPFLEVVESVQELVAEAEKFGVIVGIEGGVNHPIHTPQKMKRLLDLIDSNNIQIVFDPVNYLTIDNYTNQVEVIQEAFELFGDRMAIFHAKDFKIEGNKVVTTNVGQGLLNYDFIFPILKASKPFIDIVMEETPEPYIEESLNYLRNKYQQA
jgi:L-ribulose-5-phosphate 3-epimerase